MSPNNRRRVGQTDLEIPVLGLGTCPLGGVYAAIGDAEARSTYIAAWDAGLRLYDTAPWYGLGQAEHRTGRALYDMPRDSYILTSKVGRLLRAPRDRAAYTPPGWENPLQFEVEHVFTYDAIMRSYEDSLQRLGINRIDALYIHDLDRGYFPNEKHLDAKFRELDQGGYRALDELKSSGEIKAIGAGINEPGMITRFLENGNMDMFLVASRHTLLEQGIYESEIVPAGKKGASVIIGGPFNSGILATGAVDGAKYEYGVAPPEMVARVEKLSGICKDHGVALAAAALQFPLTVPEVSSVIFGAVSASEINDNIAHFATSIPQSLWADLEAENLIPSFSSFH